MSLLDVKHFAIPKDIVITTEKALREAGAEGYELFVLWSGTITDRMLTVRSQFVPEQTSYKTEDGLLVKVEGKALHKLNASLFDRSELLAVQVHAHPTDAYHSTTDDTYPIVTVLGGLSIVAPYFAEDGLFASDSETYRLGTEGWTNVRGRKLRKLLSVI